VVPEGRSGADKLAPLRIPNFYVLTDLQAQTGVTVHSLRSPTAIRTFFLRSISYEVFIQSDQAQEDGCYVIAPWAPCGLRHYFPAHLFVRSISRRSTYPGSGSASIDFHQFLSLWSPRRSRKSSALKPSSQKLSIFTRPSFVCVPCAPPSPLSLLKHRTGRR